MRSKHRKTRKKDLWSTATTPALIANCMLDLPRETRLAPMPSSSNANHSAKLGAKQQSMDASVADSSAPQVLPAPAPALGFTANRVHGVWVLEMSDGQQTAFTQSCVVGRQSNSGPTHSAFPIQPFVAVDDPERQISRQQFEFGVTQLGQPWVSDCGSLNGTYLIRGATMDEVPQARRILLQEGDVIRFGSMFAKVVRRTLP